MELLTLEDAVESYEGAESANATLRSLSIVGEDAPDRGGRLVGIRLENFKSFESMSVEISDFNLLVGANNTGKSTILQAIKLGDALLRQHFSHDNDTAYQKGRTFPAALLPVAEPSDLWYRKRWRAGNVPVAAKIKLEYSGGLEFEFGLRLLYGAVNSRVLTAPSMLTVEDLRRVKSLAPVLVASSFGVVTHEERRTQARVSNLIQTGRQNETVRNMIHDLYVDTPDRFEVLSELLQQHFGVTLRRTEFDPDVDQFIDARYEQKGAALDLFSAGAGFVQVVQLLTFTLRGNHGLVMLDEPDAHLHSSMQLIIVEMLETLARRFDFQVLISTHSKEIINFVAPSVLIPVSASSNAGPLDPHASAVAVLEELGAIDNIDLYSLFTSRRCCFVEGRSDKAVMTRVAAKVGSTVFEGDSRVVVIGTEGVDNFAPASAVRMFSELAGVELAHLNIRDRDGLPDECVDELRERGGDHFVVHGRDCIESYLILPGAFQRAIERALTTRDPNADSPSVDDLAALVAEVQTELAEATLDHVATAIDSYLSRSRREFLSAGELNRRAREAIDAYGDDIIARLAVVPGKRLLARARELVQERYGVSLSDSAIVEAATEEDLADLIDLVRRCEALSPP